MPKSGEEADINCLTDTRARSPRPHARQRSQASTHMRTIRAKCAKPELRELEISFAYGAVHFENPSVTREMVINSLPPLDDRRAAALIPRP